MKIDLKWLLPFVMPFLFVATARLLELFSGVVWDDAMAQGFMGVSMILGIPIGFVVSVVLNIQNIYWHVRIGGKDND